jgi:hypothetical protein
VIQAEGFTSSLRVLNGVVLFVGRFRFQADELLEAWIGLAGRPFETSASASHNRHGGMQLFFLYSDPVVLLKNRLTAAGLFC